MPATIAMPAATNMPATTAMPAEAAMLAVAAMLTELAELAKPVVAVIRGPVTNGLRHATGQGKTDADHQYGPGQYAAECHRRLRVLWVIVFIIVARLLPFRGVTMERTEPASLLGRAHRYSWCPMQRFAQTSVRRRSEGGSGL